MHQAVLLAGFAALAAGSPAVQGGIDFAAINAAPSPSLTGPPVASNSQVIPYNTASVAAAGSAMATGAASASATESALGNSKRGWPGWPWGWGQPRN